MTASIPLESIVGKDGLAMTPYEIRDHQPWPHDDECQAHLALTLASRADLDRHQREARRWLIVLVVLAVAMLVEFLVLGAVGPG